jgi:methionyl-tRNA formyltransferase
LGGTPADAGVTPGTLDGLDVIAGHGTRVRLVTVQPEGKRPMDAADWRRGVHPRPGEHLGT